MEEINMSISSKFNLGDYINEEKMKGMVERIVEERITAHIDETISRRRIGGIDITDMMVGVVIDKYIQTLDKSLEDEFKTKIKALLAGDTTKVSKEAIDNFDNQISYKLENYAKEYITQHIDDISSSINSKIIEKLDDLENYKLADILSRKVNIDEIIKSSILTILGKE